MPWRGPEHEGEYPSLGWEIIDAWAELFPSPRDESQPFILTDEQAIELVEWYSIHPVTGQFVYRRGQSRKAKGTGKSPLEAAKCITELALPCRFDGWDADGEPVARPWGTGGDPPPWVQIASLSEDQDENTYTPLHYFLTANDGKLADELGVDAGLTRCLLKANPQAKIEPVTSRAGSREGQPVTYGCLDESGLMTTTNGGVKLARTIRRNTGKMAGRTYETTNGYMPGEGSVAEGTDKAIQRGTTGIYSSAAEAPTKIDGVDIDEDAPDALLRRALEVPYKGCWWVDLDRIVSDIRDPDMPWSDAERFFFNWNRKGEGKAVDPKKWAALAREQTIPDGAWVGLGFDGSVSKDATALVACTPEGHSMVVRTWERPRRDDGTFDPNWEVPRHEVHETVRETFAKYRVGRMNCDPAKWWTEVDGWSIDHGEDIVIKFDTTTRAFPFAVDRWLTAIREGTHTHTDDDVLNRHVLAAHLKKVKVNADDDDGRTMYGLVKGDDHRKIDACIADVLALEAAQTMEMLEAPELFVIFA